MIWGPPPSPSPHPSPPLWWLWWSICGGCLLCFSKGVCFPTLFLYLSLLRSARLETPLPPPSFNDPFSKTCFFLRERLPKPKPSSFFENVCLNQTYFLIRKRLLEPASLFENVFLNQTRFLIREGSRFRKTFSREEPCSARCSPGKMQAREDVIE